MLDAAKKLNTIRNKLAHHLDYPQMEAQVREFLSLCEEPEDPEEPDDREAVPLVRRFSNAIAAVCRVVEGMGVGEQFIRDLGS